MAEQLELESSENDIRSDVAAAVEAVEKAEAPDTSTPEPVQSVESDPSPKGSDTEQTKADRDRDEKGRFAVKKTEDEVKQPVVDPKAPPVQAAAPTAPVAKPPLSTDGARPPSSWRPAAREHFASLPPEVQQEAIRVDREVRRTMQESAEARQAYAKFKETFQPYEPMLRAQNLDPFQFSANMAQTVNALANGPQQTKAEIVANVIRAYGIDLPTLAAVLDGTPAPAQQAQPQPYRDPRVDQLLQTVEQAKAQREQQLNETAQTAIRDIENEEFFWDVKDDMADLLDLAANRNLALTPREAYNRALMMHPEISRVVEQRKVVASNPQGSMARARAAASSPRASPVAPSPGNTSDRDLRGEIAAAWDAVTQSR